MKNGEHIQAGLHCFIFNASSRFKGGTAVFQTVNSNVGRVFNELTVNEL